MIKIEMEVIGIRPVSRRGLMMVDANCRMTLSQMFAAVEAIKEHIPGTTWGKWLEAWNNEAQEEAEFPHVLPIDHDRTEDAV